MKSTDRDHIAYFADFYYSQARGDVPSLTFIGGSDFNGTLTLSVAASLEGIAPLWGTFELVYGGEATTPLYVDATAGEILHFCRDRHNRIAPHCSAVGCHPGCPVLFVNRSAIVIASTR